MVFHGFQAYLKIMTQKLDVFLKKTHENSIFFLLHPSASQVPPAPEQRRKPEVKAAAWELEDHPAYWMILDGQTTQTFGGVTRISCGKLEWF